MIWGPASVDGPSYKARASVSPGSEPPRISAQCRLAAAEIIAWLAKRHELTPPA
jgi:hypothetical protein